MDLQETIVLRIKRERGSLATNYGPVGLQWTTHTSSERRQGGWSTPPWWCLDWICWFWNLWQLAWFSSTPLGFLEYWGIYRAKRRCGRPSRWAQPPGVFCSPRAPSSVLLWPTGCLLVQKKSTKGFAAFGLLLVLISCDVKNMQKTATGTGHYVNRLVPKNDIKWL